jgi:hypothetical protein
MPSYIPPTDAGFREWIENFIDYAGPHAVELGLSPANIAEMQAERVAFVAAYTAYMTAQAAAMSATENKNEKRASAEKTMRKFVNILQVSPAVSDPERALLRIPIRDKQPTPTDPTAILRVIPPKLHLGTAQPGLVVVHFGPEPANERRNAKPAGAAGARIKVLTGSVPSGTANLDALPWAWAGDDTESPYYFTATGGGTFTFRVQWFDVLMNLGPLGDPVTCAVTE